MTTMSPPEHERLPSTPRYPLTIATHLPGDAQNSNTRNGDEDVAAAANRNVSPAGETTTTRGEFAAKMCRLEALELWRELAVRPATAAELACCAEDADLLANEVDDVDELSRRCAEARRAVNDRLPPHERTVYDGELVPMESGIGGGAGLGLFFVPGGGGGWRRDGISGSVGLATIRKGEVVCYYCGHLHNFQSAKSLGDKSYLMLVSGDVLVDPGPLPQIKARYINDPLNPDLVNCLFVPEPRKRRCAVVTTRDIHPGEELFVSYGDAYWARKGVFGIVHTKKSWRSKGRCAA